MTKHVAVFGGGIGGLSAAHELLERGFSVSIYERQSIPGGKARSFPHDPTDESTLFGSVDVKMATRRESAQRVVAGDANTQEAQPQAGLPAEHGFRFFPGFYRHITDTMARTPRLGREGTVADDLVRTSELGIVRDHGHTIRLPTQAVRSFKDFRKLLTAVENAETGLTYHDLVQFTLRIWQIMTSCEPRRISEYERISWWRFIDGDNQSEAFRRYFGSLTRSLVAAQPQLASTRTNGDILVQLIIDIFNRVSHPDQVLNGPTNEVWIHPWIQHLRLTYRDKFEYYLDTSITGFEYDSKTNKIESATIAIADGVRTQKRIESCDRLRANVERVQLPSRVTADYYISAIPVERMAPLVTPEMEVGDPNLRWLKYLSTSVEWMNGIVFFLKNDVDIADGHVLYVDPGSALTSICQAQFWKSMDLAKYGRGDVAATLSVDVSNWSELLDDDLDSIPKTVWAQLQETVNSGGDPILVNENVLYAAVDPSIQEFQSEQRRILKPTGGPEKYSRQEKRQAKIEIVRNITSLVNAEPLLVNTTDSWRLRPYSDSRIQNLFLAADYVRTNTDLATMESANEAARRAVNAILGAEKSRARPAKIWPLRQVWFLAPFRWRDRRRFGQGLPWRDPLPWLPNLVPPLWKLACLLFRVKKAPAARPGSTAASRASTAATGSSALGR